MFAELLSYLFLYSMQNYTCLNCLGSRGAHDHEQPRVLGSTPYRLRTQGLRYNRSYPHSDKNVSSYSTLIRRGGIIRVRARTVVLKSLGGKMVWG